MILVENLAIHLNNEPHRPRNGDLCSSTLQRWLGALDTGIPDKEIRFLAPIVMCQMITHTPAILAQARENWKKGLFRYDPPVVANKWIRYYDLPGSKEDVVEGNSDAERATLKDTEDKADDEVSDKEEDAKTSAEMDDGTKSPTKSEDEDEDRDGDEDGDEDEDEDNPASEDEDEDNPASEDEDEDNPASEDSTNSNGETYCVCGKESYGKMIACDNKSAE
ncbi:unnamed protein product [Aureobasidium pullulans]|nr:unnamed protein product [Aureobasidium pullulans]